MLETRKFDNFADTYLPDERWIRSCREIFRQHVNFKQVHRINDEIVSTWIRPVDDLGEFLFLNRIEQIGYKWWHAVILMLLVQSFFSVYKTSWDSNTATRKYLRSIVLPPKQRWIKGLKKYWLNWSSSIFLWINTFTSKI